MPVMYVGGVENRPAVVERLMRFGPLIGNPPGVLAKVRDPLWLSDAVVRAGFPAPRSSRQPMSGRDWLRKSLTGSGGLSVRRADGRAVSPRRWYWQQFIAGEPCAAVYWADRGRCNLIGVSRQLIGEPWCGTSGFRYCGSVAPWPGDWQPWRDLGSALAADAHLHGFFGIDAVVRDGIPYVVELNPRYTASVELHSDWFPNYDGNRPAASAKAILFAAKPLRFPDRGPWDEWGSKPVRADQLPAFADIPEPGEPIPAGAPILTLLETGETPDLALEKLRGRCESLRHLLEHISV